MTGGSRARQRIVGNLLRLLEDALDPEHFDAIQEMRLDVGGRIRYPDVAVVAGTVGDAEKTLHDAMVLFEVLSEDTVDRALGPKLGEYIRLPSICRYVTIEQHRISITSHVRTPDGWTTAELTRGDLDLPEVGVALRLEAIYRRVKA
jgi:Uma2 family endonuclease